MNAELLIKEGQRLARPCVYLTQQSDGAPLAGIWGGSGLAIPNSSAESSFNHWLSFDCNFLPAGYSELQGCLSIYFDNDEGFRVVRTDKSAQLNLSHTSGINLFAHSGLSLPPIDAVLRFGSPAVHDWILSHSWQPDWPYNRNFKGRDLVDVYENYVRQHNPLFNSELMKNVFAMLGGWHEPWPEDDWEELLGLRLVAFTYRDAEPYVELWVDNHLNFKVIPRIT